MSILRRLSDFIELQQRDDDSTLMLPPAHWTAIRALPGFSQIGSKSNTDAFWINGVRCTEDAAAEQPYLLTAKQTRQRMGLSVLIPVEEE